MVSPSRRPTLIRNRCSCEAESPRRLWRCERARLNPKKTLEYRCEIVHLLSESRSCQNQIEEGAFPLSNPHVVSLGSKSPGQALTGQNGRNRSMTTFQRNLDSQTRGSPFDIRFGGKQLDRRFPPPRRPPINSSPQDSRSTSSTIRFPRRSPDTLAKIALPPLHSQLADDSIFSSVLRSNFRQVAYGADRPSMLRKKVWMRKEGTRGASAAGHHSLKLSPAPHTSSSARAAKIPVSSSARNTRCAMIDSGVARARPSASTQQAWATLAPLPRCRERPLHREVLRGTSARQGDSHRAPFGFGNIRCRRTAFLLSRPSSFGEQANERFRVDVRS